MTDNKLTQFIKSWIRKNCMHSNEALYGMCIELSDEISAFLRKNAQPHKVWGLWEVADNELHSKLPIKVERQHMLNVIKDPEYTLSDIGNQVHEVIEWSGGFWDANGKQTPEQVIANFNRDNINLHFFLLDEPL